MAGYLYREMLRYRRLPVGIFTGSPELVRSLLGTMDAGGEEGALSVVPIGEVQQFDHVVDTLTGTVHPHAGFELQHTARIGRRDQ